MSSWAHLKVNSGIFLYKVATRYICIYICIDTNTYSVCIIAYLAEIFLIYMLVNSLVHTHTHKEWAL